MIVRVTSRREDNSTDTIAASDSYHAERAEHESTVLDTVLNELITDFTPNGGKIELLEGSFTINDSISIQSGINIQGAGYKTVLTPKNSLNKPIFTSDTATALTGVKIHDLRIDGNKDNNSSGHAFHIYNPDEVYLNNLYIRNVKGDGVRFQNAISNPWGRVYLDNCYVGYNGGNGVVCNLDGGEDYKLYVMNLNNCNITTNLTGYGVYFEGSGKLGIGANTWISNNNYGVYIKNSSRPQIQNSHIEYNLTQGIVLVNSNWAEIIGCHIRDNPYTVADQPNIYINGGSNHIINGNTIYEDRSGESAVVKYNIQGANTPTSCIITNNTLIGAVTADVIGMDDASNVIEHNITTA